MSIKKSKIACKVEITPLSGHVHVGYPDCSTTLISFLIKSVRITLMLAL
jgi:hypothetical protein